MMHVKEHLLLIGKNSPCGGSVFSSISCSSSSSCCCRSGHSIGVIVVVVILTVAEK